MKIQRLTLFNESKCNLNCIYCYTKERRKKNNKISFKRSKILISQAKEMGAQKIIFAGPGEPLLNKRIFQLIDYIYQHNLQPIIFTNGTCFKRSIIDFLYYRNTGIILKLHSLDQKMYKLLAGNKINFRWIPFSFQFKQSKIKLKIPDFLNYLINKYCSQNPIQKILKKMKLRKNSPFLCLESVITSKNLNDILILAKLAKSFRIDLLLEELIPEKNKKRSNLIPSKEKMILFRRELKKILGKKRFQKTIYYGCKFNRNPVIYEDGSAGFCLVKPSKINWFKERSLKITCQKLFQDLKIPKIEYKNNSRNCYGRI